jgi:hypothetical protein
MKWAIRIVAGITALASPQRGWRDLRLTQRGRRARLSDEGEAQKRKFQLEFAHP